MNAPKSVPSTVALCAAIFNFNFFLLFPKTLGLASKNVQGLLNLSLYGRGLTCSYIVNWAVGIYECNFCYGYHLFLDGAGLRLPYTLDRYSFRFCCCLLSCSRISTRQCSFQMWDDMARAMGRQDPVREELTTLLSKLAEDYSANVVGLKNVNNSEYLKLRCLEPFSQKSLQAGGLYPPLGFSSLMVLTTIFYVLF